MKILAVVCAAIVCLMDTCPAQTHHVLFGDPKLDEVSLLGWTQQAFTNRYGTPSFILGPEKGCQTYEYTNTGLSVLFHGGKLVQYVLLAKRFVAA